MIRFAAALALSIALLAPGLPARAEATADYQTMPIAKMIEQAPDIHPAGLYILAARLLGEGEGYEAAQWMYVAQLRYRFLIAAAAPSASSEQVLFSALSESVGRPVNAYIGGDVEEWLAVMRWALDWDATHPNATTSQTEHAAAWAEQRAGLEALIADIEAQRADIPGIRTENGLENR